MLWEAIPQQGDFEKVDELGRDLSAILHCPVRYCAAHYEKSVFECKHSIVFPKFAVQGAQESGDWSQIMQRHLECLN
jgi:hypothetical protein